MKRSYYDARVSDFIEEPQDSILGKLTKNNQFVLEDLQRNSWIAEIKILKRELYGFEDGHIIFEYTIPRIGKRIDLVFIYNGIIFLIECKIGETQFPLHAINQVTDYALDLQDFHEESHSALLVPILLASCANRYECSSTYLKQNIVNIQCCGETTLQKIIRGTLASFPRGNVSPASWMCSRYKPTPTIIEAAQALYRNHTVENISRNDATAYNLSRTTQAVDEIIENTKCKKEKAICFITGVPGAGKTLAGLNIAIDRQRIDANEHAVFLSGNGPLVAVLQEALARDQQQQLSIKKTEAMRKAKEFIQIIHHFRDDALATTKAPIEKVAIFDEAQRVWTLSMLQSFMKQKKGKTHFAMSEPEFLINVMDRHDDWAVIICLIGGGQEINTGEAGLAEWFTAIKVHFPEWQVYVSNQITDSEYSRNIPIETLLGGTQYTLVPDLHLAVSLRSYRSENMAAFVKALLDFEASTARALYTNVSQRYPILMTRNFENAKTWVREQAKGTQRYGIIASSGAKRLKKYSIWVQSKIDAVQWFLNNNDDVRSSYFLEETATEFDIQGLELDWTIVCWDANLRICPHGLEYYTFKGTRWMNINKTEDKEYLKNAYRVLLTRARQGFVIFIPSGDNNDGTRQESYYDGTYNYLKQIGIQEI